MKSARVICRESSYSFATRIRTGNHPDSHRKRYTRSLVCTGEEDRLQDCKRSLVTVSKCQNGEGIIDCSDGKLIVFCVVVESTVLPTASLECA